MQLVVERPRSLHERCELGDPGQLARLVGRVVEALRELLCEDPDLGAEHRYEPAGEERSGHLVQRVLGGRGTNEPFESALLPEDRAVESLESRPRLDAQLLQERPARFLVGVQRIRLAPGVRYEDTLDPEGWVNIPHLANEIVPQGLVYPVARYDGITGHFN